MKTKLLAELGVPRGSIMDEAIKAIVLDAETGTSPEKIQETIKAIILSPDTYSEDPCYGNFASQFARYKKLQDSYDKRETPVPYRMWGEDFDQSAITQLHNACSLPISVRGALMPDAHVGYGLPIGGVLATKGAVIPYAVGVDIACRMKMTVVDLPVSALDNDQDKLRQALCRETIFGVGAKFKRKHRHDVMDRDWSFSPVTNRLKDKAWGQLGTSGSGNHFVEFGSLQVFSDELSIGPGTYLALLSHSGSRGTGNEVARYYSTIAKEKHPELPRELSQFSWLDMESEEGLEYWAAMELMGHYASANHELIHTSIAKNLGVEVLLDIENHHNFAWKENHFGEEVIVHRKGATPAAKDVFGIIPGSMATPGYVVKGKGLAESLCSASHGAGRAMSRKAAKTKFNWEEAKKFIANRGVELISAGLDEVPMAYKDIDLVMEAQSDLVETVARFDPKLVRMARGNERPED